MTDTIIGKVLAGATPTIDEFVLALGDRLNLLQEYKSTLQDSEWHAEGDVYIHTGMVLDETYQILATEATHLDKEELKEGLRAHQKIVWDATNLRWA